VVLLHKLTGVNRRQQLIEIAHARIERRTHKILAPVLAVIQGAVTQGVLHPQRMKGCAVKNATAAKTKIGKQVRMGLYETKYRTVFKFCDGNVACCVKGELGKCRTLALLNQRHIGRSGLGHHGSVNADIGIRFYMLQLELAIRCGQQLPLTLGLQAILHHDLAINLTDVRGERRLAAQREAIGYQIAATFIIEQVFAQIGRSQQKAAGVFCAIGTQVIGLLGSGSRNETRLGVRRNRETAVGNSKDGGLIGRHKESIVTTVAAAEQGQAQHTHTHQLGKNTHRFATLIGLSGSHHNCVMAQRHPARQDQRPQSS